jgi:hypothetical protein
MKDQALAALARLEKMARYLADDCQTHSVRDIGIIRMALNQPLFRKVTRIEVRPNGHAEITTYEPI